MPREMKDSSLVFFLLFFLAEGSNVIESWHDTGVTVPAGAETFDFLGNG